MKGAFALPFMLALAAPALASAYAAFSTPGRAAYCGITEGPAPLSLICWTPSDGLTLNMLATGRAQARYYRPNKGYYDDFAPVLAFGHSWEAKLMFTCRSTATGLTCTNQQGHGWWLGRSKGYRIF